MFNLEKIVRPNILSLKPYSSARDEFKGGEGIFIDANENPFGKVNRYPDPKQKELKEKLSEFSNVATSNIFIGNGSDEIIDLVYRTFCIPGKDKALTFSPTYGMYKVAADIHDTKFIEVPLNSKFQIELSGLKYYLSDKTLKLIFICSPNNPTGNLIKAKEIEFILKTFKGIVFLDQAYIEFSKAFSWSKKLNRFPNLIVCQTLSKAWGLAGARIGVAYASPQIISLFNKVKSPYNVSALNQLTALQTLSKPEFFMRNLETILAEKIKLEVALKEMKFIKKVYPSDANFFLVEVDDANKIYQELIDNKVITRNRNNIIANCIRLTVGSPKENKKLIGILNNIAL